MPLIVCRNGRHRLPSLERDGGGRERGSKEWVHSTHYFVPFTVNKREGGKGEKRDVEAGGVFHERQHEDNRRRMKALRPPSLLPGVLSLAGAFSALSLLDPRPPHTDQYSDLFLWPPQTKRGGGGGGPRRGLLGLAGRRPTASRGAGPLSIMSLSHGRRRLQW